MTPRTKEIATGLFALLISILAVIWWKRKRNGLAKDKEMNVFKSSSRPSESEMMQATAPQSRVIEEAPEYDYSIKTPPHQRKSMSRSMILDSPRPSFLFSIMTSEPLGLHLPGVGSSIESEQQNV
jgi:hypothetical protein